MDTLEKTIKEIKSLKIQGSTAVARASLKALARCSGKDLTKAAEKLGKARPTEPLARNCLTYVVWQVQRGGSVKEAVSLMLSRLDDIENQIVNHGLALVKPGMRILTHCHSSNVENLLKTAHQQGIDFFVYVTETRPLFQGRITAQNLTRAGIKTTMIADSAAGSTLSHLDKIEIDLVFLGSDAIAADGDCVNKIGSFAISLAAQEAKIPLYILATPLKFSSQAKTGEEIKIEERDPAEVWKNPPQKLKILNLAFDIIPQDKITGYLTEFGLIKPKKLRAVLKKNYPWIIKKSKVPPEARLAKGGKKREVKKAFSYLRLGLKPDLEKHIIATYRLSSSLTLKEMAEQVAAESSIGTWTKIIHQTEKRFEQLSAKIFDLNKRTGISKIAYPLTLFEPGNIPQLLSSLAGNVFGMKSLQNLRLLDIDLPETYVKSFSGPSFGFKGIRDYLDIHDRPILGSIIKPKEGLTSKEQVELARQIFLAGIDLVKDDENLTSPDFNPFDQRLALMMKEIRQIKKQKLYAFNITAPYELMRRRAQRVKNAAGKCVLIDILTVGFSGLQSLRRQFPDLIFHGHRAMHAAMTRNKQHGITMLVWAKLARLAGIDQLHTGTIIGKMEGEEKEVLKINKFLMSEWYGLKQVLPIASGGLYPSLIPKLIEILGKDMVFAFGGGIHGHPQGAAAGAQAVVEAVKAVNQRISLIEHAQKQYNLKIALEKWPEEKKW